MSPHRPSPTIAWWLLALLLLAPAGAAGGLRPPKQLCLVWTHSLDPEDMLELNFLIRPVPGKLTARFADQSPAVVRFYELTGMDIRGDLSSSFVPLHGGGWMYAVDSFLAFGVTAVTPAGATLLQGTLSLLAPVTGGFTRIAPDGSSASGTFTTRPCTEAVIND